MHIDILTLFPEMLTGSLGSSILKRAVEKQQLQYDLINFRDFSENKHQKVDDYPYGGGAGMVLTPQPIFDAVAYAKARQETEPSIILMCPQGETYTQKKAETLAQKEHLIIICGHYEGYDERIRKALVTDEISIGDYVLTSGEIGALVVMDSVVRLLPDVLGNEVSAKEDSFSTGLLEHPHYTRPADYKGMKVPDVLMEGNHAKIDAWRKEQALKRTLERRPDLLQHLQLSDEESAILDALMKQQTNDTSKL